jgi:hypothetical protein
MAPRAEARACDMEGAMRITLLLLAAGMSVAASGGAVAAEVARGTMVRSGGSHGGWNSGGWGLGFNSWQPRRHHPGRGHGRPWHYDGQDRAGRDRPGHHDSYDGHDRHGGHDRRDRWRGHRGGDHAYAYGAGGFAGPYEAVDPYGTGFFAGAGGGVRLRGGRPQFDYDRSYPYEWASVAGGREVWEVEEIRAAPPPGRCTMENGVRVCRGW